MKFSWLIQQKLPVVLEIDVCLLQDHVQTESQTVAHVVLWKACGIITALTE
jgi:hypothetical protein